MTDIPAAPAPRAVDRLALGIAVFVSGAAALVYETIWTRTFSIILGSTVQAASATFAAFLVGLAAGAWLFGRRSPPPGRAVRAYLGIELAIALTAPAAGLVIHRGSDALTEWLGAGSGALGSFGVVLALVLVPTVLMGATFPLMMTVARRSGAGVPVIGRLYAINTFGAACGTLVCGFFLIRLFGVERSLAIGAGLNALAAVAAAALLVRARADADSAPASTGAAPRPAAQPASAAPALPVPILLTVAGASGLMVLALEIVWTRLAAYFLGNRTYAFTTLLACVLVLLAIGSWLSGRLTERFGDRPIALFGWTLAAALACTLGSTVATWWWIENQGALEPMLPAAADLLLAYRGLETFALLAPPLIALGCLFPMSLMASRCTPSATGRAAGTFYVANTAGAVLGSLATGFWGVSALGTFGCVAAVIAIGGGVTLLVFGSDLADGRRRAHGARFATVAAIFVAVPFALPSRLSVVPKDGELVFRREDEYGVMQVVRRPGGVITVTNNRTELVFHLGLASTSYVQQMQGHLGVFYNPSAQSALVLGSGYGITTGALAQYPDIRTIDSIEIIPGMVEAADLFRPFNFGYHRDPRVRQVLDDGRHYLARSDRRYDIISVNVSDPHLPGAAPLFHLDFYEVVKAHLNKGGVVIQHAFGSDVDLVLRTLLHAFADVHLYPSYDNGFNVVAADHALAADPDRVDALLEIPAVRSALRGIGMLPPLTPGGLVRSAVRREAVERRVGLRGPVASDDRPALEFAWSANPARLLNSNE